jgi:hypothetical protein
LLGELGRGRVVGMRILTVIVLCLSLALAPAVASAKGFGPPIEGRHSILRAGMYATAFEGERSRVQVLDRLCPKPGHRAGCGRVIVALREALDDVVPVPIRWVSREHDRAVTFYEFSPIDREHARASFDYRWDDPRPYGCNGGGTLEFQRIDFTGWRETGGNFFEGCPVAGMS